MIEFSPIYRPPEDRWAEFFEQSVLEFTCWKYIFKDFLRACGASRSETKSFVCILQRMEPDKCPSLRYHWGRLQPNVDLELVSESKIISTDHINCAFRAIGGQCFSWDLEKPTTSRINRRIISHVAEKAWDSLSTVSDSPLSFSQFTWMQTSKTATNLFSILLLDIMSGGCNRTWSPLAWIYIYLETRARTARHFFKRYFFKKKTSSLLLS